MTPKILRQLALCALVCGLIAAVGARAWVPDKTRWDYIGEWRGLVFIRQPAAFEDMSIGAYRGGDLEFTMNFEQFNAMYWPMRVTIRPEPIENPDFSDSTQHQDGIDSTIPWQTANGIIYRPASYKGKQ